MCRSSLLKGGFTQAVTTPHAKKCYHSFCSPLCDTSEQLSDTRKSEDKRVWTGQMDARVVSEHIGTEVAPRLEIWGWPFKQIAVVSSLQQDTVHDTVQFVQSRC